MIDVTRRLRRAVHRNDLDLVRRIVTNEPHVLRNPDYDDKSNTSLHLAAKEGFVEIAAFLIEAGHEDEGISHNADWDTPLMLAAVNRQTDVGELLVRQFPRCVPWTNKAGMDALMLASRHGTYSLLPPLLTCPTPASVHTHDRDGNTALHHASAAGELKALRLLLQFGASPLAQNAYSWTPVAYSATASAELYFKSLVAEIEKQRVEMGGRERARPAGGGVRLVTSEDALGVQGQRALDDEGVGMSAPQFDGNWSPVEQRRAMTPTAGRSEAWPGSAAALRGAPPLPSAGGNVMRQRAESGE